MGQRFVELPSSYEGFENKTAVLHVSQLPPNAAVISPGPALLFVVVNGIPSVGVQVMVGSGQIETQKMQDVASLPESKIERTGDSGSGSKGGNSSGGYSKWGRDEWMPMLLVLWSCLVVYWC
jgi:hypothetical protein